MTEQEIVVNLKNEIEKYAAAKSHTHSDYTPDNNVTSNSSKPVKSSGIVTYVTNAINNAIQTFQTGTLPSIIQENITTNMFDYATKTSLNNYLKKTDAQNTYATKTELAENSNTNIYANPQLTQTKIDQLLLPGYYQYVGSDATFYCKPDNIHYTNGLIRVEKQGNHLIQHVYATSYSTSAQKYKIDGREFVRYGYTSTANDITTPHWESTWRVANIPWKKRNDLLKLRGTNISENGFSIYECTAGYVFQWKQSGTQQAYTLPMTQYSYASVYTFKDLPITGPYVFGNLIGHIDIKITENDFRVRSVNKKNEKIVGVNESYFVPRTN